MSLQSLGKLDSICEQLTDEMRVRAGTLVSAGYKDYYRDAFMRAYRFFSTEMKDFREQLKIMEGDLDLFWREVDKIYRDLAAIEAAFASRRPKKRLRISDLDRPDLKTAFKLHRVPKSFEDFREGLGYSTVITGFHPTAFAKWEWREKFWRVVDFKSARYLVFEDRESMQVDLFSSSFTT